MNTVVLTKNYEELPFCKEEILRYAGCKNLKTDILALLDECVNEIKNKLTYKVCYIELPIIIAGEVCDFGVFKVHSQKLALNLADCDKVIIFAATVGIEIDRLIVKYGYISPSKAVMFQAIGAERIEALCDAFCKEISQEIGAELKPRFSPGYSDLPLETQKYIFSILECDRRIGLTLNGSMLMSPTKSVTAFVGIKKD